MVPGCSCIYLHHNTMETRSYKSAFIKLILFASSFSILLCNLPERSPKVAVIGAGIGGTASAFFLSQHIPDAEIHIYEAGRVGGRLATVSVGGREYEMGGAFVHPDNLYMGKLLQHCGLEKALICRAVNQPFSLHKGGRVVFEKSEYGVVSKAQMVWRYGPWSLVKLGRFIKKLMGNFGRVYPALDKGVAFPSLASLLEEMGPEVEGGNSREMVEMTEETLEDLMDKEGFSDAIKELGLLACKLIYGQTDDDVHAFVGAASLAAMDERVWAVNGGNYRVPLALVKQSGAELRKAKVGEVLRNEDGKFTIKFSPQDDTNYLFGEGTGNAKKHVAKNQQKEDYDMVIIAAPQVEGKSKIKFTGFSSPPASPGPYHRTVATVVHGQLNREAFGPEDQLDGSNTHFFISPDSLVVSLDMMFPSDYDPAEDEAVSNVWKVMTRRPLTDEELDNLFTTRDYTVVADWLAYPHYRPGKAEDFGNFVLGGGAFYTSAGEWAASAMEMSAIAGKNVANAALQYWTATKNIKEEASHTYGKVEL